MLTEVLRGFLQPLKANAETVHQIGQAVSSHSLLNSSFTVILIIGSNYTGSSESVLKTNKQAPLQNSQFASQFAFPVPIVYTEKRKVLYISLLDLIGLLREIFKLDCCVCGMLMKIYKLRKPISFQVELKLIVG
jgi:hypothetical protein